MPCKQYRYEPSFSYAQLSQFNVERIVLKNPARRRQVEERFALAMEYSQRVDPGMTVTPSEKGVCAGDRVFTITHFDPDNQDKHRFI